MIAISNSNGQLLRMLPDLSEEVVYGFHRRFGWITEAGARKRLQNRLRHGLKGESADWLMKFTLQPRAGGFAVQQIAGCRVRPGGDTGWILESDKGEFFLSSESAKILDFPATRKDSQKTLWISAAVLAILAALFFIPRGEVIAPEPVKEEPVVIKVVQPPKSVVVPMSESVRNIRSPVEQQSTKTQTQNVIRKEVGFLELLGKKELSKAAGGRPIELTEASPGAGAGGKEGSGGELLTGLGEGLRKTTVGNTGVAGLGGIGTKGRGGGQGGYGDVAVAGGSGGRISTVALSKDLVVEGGLSQAVIQATIAKYLNQIRACYEDGLSKNPGLVGLVTTRFDIGAAGNVESSQVTNSSLGNKGVEDCILRKMGGWQFPKPVGGVKVRVNYPFLLKPVQS